MPELAQLNRPQRTYRDPSAFAFGGLGAIIFLIGGILYALDGSVDLGIQVASSLIAFAGSAACAWFLVRPRLELYPASLKVVNPMSRHVISFGELATATGGRWLRLRLRSGEDVRVWCVSNSNLTLLRRSKGRTELVADEINSFVEDRRRHASSDG